MASALVLGLFVILGLGTVFVAMSGGVSHTRETLEGAPGGIGGATFLTLLVIAAFGVAIPTYVLLDNSGDEAKAGPAGSKLNASLEQGREMFVAKCATCHALKDSRSVGRVGPDLDVRPPTASLTLNAIKEGRARGQGQMPAELLDGEDARNVARYVEKVAGR